ncbi:MAG: hypothetical protein R3D71_05895 [Rickettsiales bacterium]
MWKDISEVLPSVFQQAADNLSENITNGEGSGLQPYVLSSSLDRTLSPPQKQARKSEKSDE